MPLVLISILIGFLTGIETPDRIDEAPTASSAHGRNARADPRSHGHPGRGPALSAARSPTLFRTGAVSVEPHGTQIPGKETAAQRLNIVAARPEA
jgi:hypothetical protein